MPELHSIKLKPLSQLWLAAENAPSPPRASHASHAVALHWTAQRIKRQTNEIIHIMSAGQTDGFLYCSLREVAEAAQPKESTNHNCLVERQFMQIIHKLPAPRLPTWRAWVGRRLCSSQVLIILGKVSNERKCLSKCWQLNWAENLHDAEPEPTNFGAQLTTTQFTVMHC